MEFKKALKFINNQGFTAYEIHKKTGLNEAGVRRILNKEVENPQRKTKEALIKFAKDNLKPIQNDTNKLIANEKEKKVPYYDIDVTSGITRSFSDVVEEPSFYVDYQPFNDCTAYVNNYGDSMFPKYKNGERLAVKQVFNFDIIMWGETYLVITNENADNYKAVKDIHPHEDLSKIILRSFNPAYKGDTLINKEDIIAMFAVKGKISQNFI